MKIEPKEVIEVLEYCTKHPSEKMGDRYVVSLDIEFVKTIVDLLKKQPQWISVDEQVPSETTYDCLVYQSHGSITSATFYPFNKLHQWMCGDEWIRNVTHWMPLPEPPRKVGERDGRDN